ncbi:MAG: AbrB/MazE/SpoVT family DNA-binding domain-containing protein [Spirochaetaceae bacterium]|nr:MAG: AbrB/MazE/SpoVT family DNA-binding domain-containing protein [Spirochaetaceae bacterium]
MDLFNRALRVDAVISVDERGQMVLPKDVRQRAGINPGDKLALVSYESEGSVCCLWLMKTEQLLGSVRESLGPLMSALAASGDSEDGKTDTDRTTTGADQ